MKKIILFLFSFVIISAQKISLVGTVIDSESKEPLVGANVVIQSDRLNTGSASNFEGTYRINDLNPNTYNIKVTYIGYENFESTISLEEQIGGEFTYNIELDISAIQLQEYVVTASRGRREKITDAPAAISVISELKIRSASNPNLGDYFKNIKGVDFTSSGLDSYNISARGFNSSFSSRLLTLTDGRMANVPSLRLIAYNVIPLTSDDVSQIEVVLGPSSALYGPNAHAGVVNIITKRPSESLGTTIGYTTGDRSFNKAQVRHAGQITNKLSYKMSFVNFSANDWEYIEDDEKKAHFAPWLNDDDDLKDLLDGYLEDGLAWWDGWDLNIDRDGNGTIDTTYKKSDNLVKDRNGDGLNDIPDFKIKNQRFDIRMDYDFSDDHFTSFNFGQAKATNLNITGIGRYQANDWIYRFYQARWVYKNWFAQAYLNTSNSGKTANLRTGGIVTDRSTFFHFQFQHSKEFKKLWNTKLIWGGDYQRTMPETYGTILPDGTGGLNPKSYGRDGIDNDGDGEIDEWDELFTTNEYGVYTQTQTKLGQYFELILSGRIDLHSGQLNYENKGFTFIEDPLSGNKIDYNPQFSPKVGLLYKPNENHTFRLTAAKAFNTPSSNGLYLDVKAANYSIFGIYALGNKDGYSYIRNKNDKLMMYDVQAGSTTEFRLREMPENSVLYVPAVLGRPGKFVNADAYRNIDPIRSEVVWTYEFGYTGMISNRLKMTFDLYSSNYSDFVSDLTWVTPVVLDTMENGWYGVDNPDPKILGIISLKEKSRWVDGGDGIPGSRYITFGSDEWNEISSRYVTDPISGVKTSFWAGNQSTRQGSWLDINAQGDTLGAYYTDDNFTSSPNLALTSISYGKISLWGFDSSIYMFLTRKLSADLNLSYIANKGYWNPLLEAYDPINAPRYKINGKLTYMNRPGFMGNIGFRYIPEFEWSAGVHYGTIDSYMIIDTMVGYQFKGNLSPYSLLLNINNLNNDEHREIIGGPKLGRNVTLKLNARF